VRAGFPSVAGEGGFPRRSELQTPAPMLVSDAWSPDPGFPTLIFGLKSVATRGLPHSACSPGSVNPHPRGEGRTASDLGTAGRAQGKVPSSTR